MRNDSNDGLDVNVLLDDDELCLEKLSQWQIKTQSNIMNSKGDFNTFSLYPAQSASSTTLFFRSKEGRARRGEEATGLVSSQLQMCPSPRRRGR